MKLLLVTQAGAVHLIREPSKRLRPSCPGTAAKSAPPAIHWTKIDVREGVG
jgi:hypothetical protein